MEIVEPATPVDDELLAFRLRQAELLGTFGEGFCRRADLAALGDDLVGSGASRRQIG